MCPGKIVTQYEFDTEYTADSAEFCPCAENTDLLLCGTYQLTDPAPPGRDTAGEDGKSDVPNRRIGRLYMFSAPNDGKYCCTEVARKETAGVLDMKWNASMDTEKPMFAVADSSGSVSVYSVNRCSDPGVTNAEIQQVSSACVGKVEENILALSLDWSTVVDRSSPTKLIISDSGGRLSLVMCDGGDVTVQSQWKAHDFEAWISAFNAWDTNLVYSGGDDCLFKGWDLRAVDKPAFVSKRHEMGVVSIQSNPVTEHQLATGSYDEHLLIWDTRQIKRPLSDTHLGGGIFRVKWQPVHAGKILTASMHNGFHVLDSKLISSDGSSLPVIAQYINKKHGSLAYGADWSRQVNVATVNTDLIATCSFYDHSLHIWNFIT